MDFEQLKTFVEVTRLKSFSRVAEKLGVTQPAISAQIRSLENEVGSRLFDRDGGKVTFTAAGRLFEAFAEHCLQCHRHIVAAIGELEHSARGEISISASEATSLYVLPNVFSQFKKQYSKVSLQIVRSARPRTIELVMDREVDFGIVTMPIKDARLRYQPIHEDEIVLVVPANHPLSDRESVKFLEIVQYPLILLKHGRQREQIDHLFRSNDVNARVAMEINSSELLKGMIAAGLGLGFLPSTNIRKEERAGTMRGLQVEGVRMRRKLAVILRKDKVLTRAAEAFLEIATGGASLSEVRSGKSLKNPEPEE
jgi:DNA-binding transcriptional LysR family regulator